MVMQRLRTLTVLAVVTGVVAGAVGGAVALRPDAAPADDHPGPGNGAMRQPVAPEFRSMLREMRASNIEATIDRLVSFGTRQTLSSTTDPNRGIGAARDDIFATLSDYAKASGGRMTVEKQTFIQPASPNPNDRIPRDTEITNVIATLKGTQPESADRVYVVSGHYDSRCTGAIDATCDAPGADDDGSGVAAMMEMARVMATHRFDATIKFMAVAGEEEGLYGSAHFAQDAKAQGMDVEGMLNNDIIGSSTGDHGQRDPFTIRLFAEGVPTSESPQDAATRTNVGGENDSPARQLARYVKDVAENDATRMTVRLIWRRDRYLRGGDQISFLQQGFPAVRFTEPNENFDHEHQDVRVENGVQFGDLPQFVDFAFTDRVARVNALTLANLADAPVTPKNAKIVTANLTNDTDLKWDPNPEPDLAGYEVVWRETTDALWTHVIPVGNVTSFTATGLSKDNVFFGVRAIDADGNRSPVAFPKPSAS
jgi:acetylornithine deacetylase/succinyl-diaminopimelate desuccinylase-like protein